MLFVKEEHALISPELINEVIVSWLEIATNMIIITNNNTWMMNE